MSRSWRWSGRERRHGQLVEPTGVLPQEHGLVLGTEIVALQDLVDLLHAVVHGDLVREVRCEHEGLRADALDRVSQPLLVPLAADVDAAALEVSERMLLQRQT